MDNQIIKYNYFNPENIHFLGKKLYDGLTKVGISYWHSFSYKTNIIIETPWMYVPFGLGKYDNKNKDLKYYLDISFLGFNENMNLQQFYNIIDKLDKYIIYYVRKNLDKLGEVIQAAAFVFKDSSLYLFEFKNVISLFVAFVSDSKPYIFRLFLFDILSRDPITLAISLKGKGPFIS